MTVTSRGRTSRGALRQSQISLGRALAAATNLVLVRPALMWLTAAQQPLRAGELWIALKIGHKGDDQRVERVLLEHGEVSDEEAVSMLQGLLGDLISTGQNTDDPECVYVCLNNFGSKGVLNKIGGKRAPWMARSSLRFTDAKAHLFVARVCMAICSATTLQLSHTQTRKRRALSLVDYAWTYWSTHLGLSQCTFSNHYTSMLANRMIRGVCTDTMAVLLELSEFVTGPVTFPAGHDRAMCHLLVKAAQAALGRPIRLLSGLLRQGRFARTLETARGVFEASEDQVGSSLRVKAGVENGGTFPGTNLNFDTDQLGDCLRRLGLILDESDGQTIQVYADIACGLRFTIMVFGQEPLNEAVSVRFSSGSPAEILAYVSCWMEDVASYPSWGSGFGSDHLVKKDRPGSNHNRGLSKAERSPAEKDGPKPARLVTRAAMLRLANISPLRWRAARLVYRVRGLFTPAPESTFTINGRQLVDQTSSLACFPSTMADIPLPIPFIIRTLLLRFISCLPDSLRSLYHRHLHYQTTLLRSCLLHGSPDSKTTMNNAIKDGTGRSSSSSTLAPVLSPTSAPPKPNAEPLSVQNRTANQQQPKPQNQPTPRSTIETTLLAQGYRKTLTHLLIAATLNHIRRTLIPWTGQFIWHTNPLNDLRLAVSNPEVFVAEMLSGWSYTSVVRWSVVKGVVDFCGELLDRELVRLGSEVATGGMGLGWGLGADGGEVAGVADGQEYEAEGRGQASGVGVSTKTKRRVGRRATGTMGSAMGNEDKRRLEMRLEIVTVGYLVWLLLTVEYVFARGMNTAAWLVACYKLLVGGEVGHLAFGMALAANWHRVPLPLWLLVQYLVDGVWPLVMASVRCAVRGQPGLLIVALGAVGVVIALLKYRSRIFIALEITGMFVFLGYMLVGVLGLGWGFWSDPLGLTLSTELARARGAQGRDVLCHGMGLRIRGPSQSGSTEAFKADTSSEKDA